MRYAAETGHIEGVWCLSADRLARMYGYQVIVLDELSRHGVTVRFTDEFLLLTDDREALIELIETRIGGEEGALEALGFDPADLSAVDPEPFAALAADWRALRKRAGETNTVPFFLPGYREVMARAATLAAIGDVPADLRRLVERMLEEHRGNLARDREVGDLVRRIQGHWRRWPQLGCAAPAEGEGSRYDA